MPYSAIRFDKCGVNNLPNSETFTYPNGTWKPDHGTLEPKVFEMQEVLNPGRRKFSPTNSKLYSSSIAMTFLWLNEIDRYPDLINNSTDWEGGPSEGDPLLDNPHPECGHWTWGSGDNRRSGNAANFYYQFKCGDPSELKCWNMGHASSVGGDIEIGSQPQTRDTYIIGFDGYMRAIAQTKGSDTLLGMTLLKGMWSSQITMTEIKNIIAFLQCLADDDCEVRSLPVLPPSTLGRVMELVANEFIIPEIAIPNNVSRVLDDGDLTDESAVYALKNLLTQTRQARIDYNKSAKLDLGDIDLPVIENVIKILQAIANANLGSFVVSQLDFLIDLDTPTDVNTYSFHDINKAYDSEYWGKNSENNWGWHRVSYYSKRTDLLQSVNVIGSFFNGYYLCLHHSPGGNRQRKMMYSCVVPLKTASMALPGNDRRQDKFSIARHYWHNKDLQNIENRIARKYSRFADSQSGPA